MVTNDFTKHFLVFGALEKYCLVGFFVEDRDRV